MKTNSKITITIENLLIEYFSNKDDLKKLKSERAKFSAKKGCHDDDFFTCFSVGKKANELCPVCAEKHKYFLEIKKLAHRNSTIMKMLKNRVL